MVARLKGRPTPPGPSKDEVENNLKGVKKRSPFLVTLAIVSIVLATVSSATLIYLTINGGGLRLFQSAEINSSETQSTGPLFNLGPFVMNLGNIEERRYLRVSLSLDFQTRDSGFVGKSASAQNNWREKTREELKKHEPIMKDLVLSTLSSRSANSLGTAMGREELKADLMAQFNQHMPDNIAVQQIYFTDFVIQ